MKRRHGRGCTYWRLRACSDRGAAWGQTNGDDSRNSERPLRRGGAQRDRHRDFDRHRLGAHGYLR